MAQSLAVLCVLSADITGSSRDAYVYEDQFYVEVKIVDLISQGFFFHAAFTDKIRYFRFQF